jgi:hypothetical protein
MANIIICDSSAVLASLAFRVRQHFIVIVALGVAGDDVPGVQEAREIAKHAQEDVDQGVGGTEA